MTAGHTAIVRHEGKDTVFNITNPDDYIQRIQNTGVFYELTELTYHQKLIYHDCVVLDVGANIGNHTMFYYNHTPLSVIYPFEPNPPAREVLLKNVASNAAEGRVDLRYADLAAGAAPATYDIEFSRQNNLGATALKPAEAGAGGEAIKGARLDDLQFAGRIGFIKMDVEGMEMQVLQGAERLFRDHRPYLAIEVDWQNEAAFWKWLEDTRYHVIEVFHHYAGNRNYIAVPKG